MELRIWDATVHLELGIWRFSNLFRGAMHMSCINWFGIMHRRCSNRLGTMHMRYEPGIWDAAIDMEQCTWDAAVDLELCPWDAAIDFEELCTWDAAINWFGNMHMRCISWFGGAMHMRCSNWGGAWHMRCSNRAHICHEYHELYCLVEKFLEILIKFLEILWNFENFWETLPQFTHVRCSNWFGAMHIGNCWFAGAMQMRCKS